MVGQRCGHLMFLPRLFSQPFFPPRFPLFPPLRHRPVIRDRSGYLYYPPLASFNFMLGRITLVLPRELVQRVATTQHSPFPLRRFAARDPVPTTGFS